MLVQLQKTPPRIVLLLLVAVAMLIITALATYVVWPQYRDYRKALATLGVLESVATGGALLEQEMADMQQKVETLGHRLHGDMVDLPANQMESFIIGRLQGVSWRNHVDLLSVTPGRGGRVQMFQEVLFDVRVAGDYFDIYRWLQEMREELGYVVVKQFSITPGVAAAEGQRLTAMFTIVSYREDDGHA